MAPEAWSTVDAGVIGGFFRRPNMFGMAVTGDHTFGFYGGINYGYGYTGRRLLGAVEWRGREICLQSLGDQRQRDGDSQLLRPNGRW